MDRYSGPASCLWSLRSLVSAYALPADAPFWTNPTEPLPVEQIDYEVMVPATGWRIEGVHASGEIRLTFAADHHGRVPRRAWRVTAHSLWRRLLEVVLRRPLRPYNTRAKYARSVYSSATPFCCDEGEQV